MKELNRLLNNPIYTSIQKGDKYHLISCAVYNWDGRQHIVITSAQLVKYFIIDEEFRCY
jgi:hypothetical protein